MPTWTSFLILPKYSQITPMLSSSISPQTGSPALANTRALAPILCYYTNVSSCVQILRLTNALGLDAIADPRANLRTNSRSNSIPDSAQNSISDFTPAWSDKVVFSGQRFLFQALPTAKLQIFVSEEGQERFIDQIQCQHLRVSQGNEKIQKNTSPLLS